MYDVIVGNGVNRNYQPSKVLSIPISGIYQDVENKSVFLFALTYARNGKTIFFDVRRASDGVFVNEYHMFDDVNNYVYYKATSDSIDVYVNQMLNTGACITCLNHSVNPNIKYYEFQTYTEEVLTKARILGFGNEFKNSLIDSVTIRRSEIENLYVKRFNVNQDQEVIKIDVSKYIGNNSPNGYLKVVNICAVTNHRYGEYSVLGDSVKGFNMSSTQINVTFDNTTKIFTISNLGRGGLVIQYQPMYNLP